VKPLHLSAATGGVLDRILAVRLPLAVYGATQSSARERVKDDVTRRLNAYGIIPPSRGFYRTYVEEMLKAFRTLTGAALAHALERAIRQWINFGLEPGLLQTILCDCHLRFEQEGRRKADARGARRGKTKPKPRRSYRQLVAMKWGSRAKAGSAEKQAKAYETARARNKDLSNQVSGLLAARKVPGREVRRYNAFVYRLDRYCRNYALKSLEIAAAGVVDDFEAEGLDRDTLVAIAATMFGLTRLG
jgi:hypothetical protein